MELGQPWVHPDRIYDAGGISRFMEQVEDITFSEEAKMGGIEQALSTSWKAAFRQRQNDGQMRAVRDRREDRASFAQMLGESTQCRPRFDQVFEHVGNDDDVEASR
ncbi:MAG: hypothetical protein NVSMB22_17720 [Chloroflexota bacterium]